MFALKSRTTMFAGNLAAQHNPDGRLLKQKLTTIVTLEQINAILSRFSKYGATETINGVTKNLSTTILNWPNDGKS